jgi:hypothetical protein
VVALPYDRDSILASLESRNHSRRPHTAELDSLFARFRGPFTAYTSVIYTATLLRDRLSHMKDSLDAISRDSPEYRRLRARVDRLSDSLTALEIGSERARTRLAQARADFVRRSETLRAAVRLWEDSTYRGYDSIVEALTKRSGMEPTTDTTDATGWARFSLGPGRWWLYAHAWDTSDPNSEWYWNVPVEEDTVLLSSRTGHRRPRY